MWQLTQRALPLNSARPRCAAGRQRLAVAAGEAVERRVQKDQRALEAGDGAAEIVIVRRAAVRLLKQALVSRVGLDGRHGGWRHPDGPSRWG